MTDTTASGPRLYFSDFYEVDADIIESYGAVND